MKQFDIPIIYRSPLITAIKNKRKVVDKMKKDFIKGDSTEFCGVAFVVFSKMEYKDLFLEEYETSFSD